MNSKALVTGASSGIGFAYSNYLASQGWDLSLISNDKERSKKAESDLAYKNARFYLYDLGKPDSIKSILNSQDTPDLIVANAGIAINGQIGELNSDEKSHAYYLMCGGVMDLIEGFVPKMIERGNGRIVIISSIGAITAMPKSSIYSSIKSGVYAYGKSISAELKNKGISVTVSLPGYVRTPAHNKAGLNHLEKKVPNWMWVDPDQVVKETERASIKGKTEIVPGIVYKITKPFLGLNIALNTWKSITKRK
tara:strand:- start:1942 stop:2694 length:753 start_codon:yes stop_codon:yes gene_type:complete